MYNNIEVQNKGLDWMVPILEQAVILSRSKKFYDVDSSSLGDIEKVFREEAVVDDIRKRIVKADNYLEEQVHKDKWDWNEHSDSEKVATINAFELAKMGSNMVVWISPEGGSYKEGRLNIYLPIFNDGEWSLQGYGIPLLKNQDESLILGKQLVNNGGKMFGNVEDLRRQPVGFKIDNQEKWLEECQKLMPEFTNLWKFIKSGGEHKQKEKVLKAVLYAKDKAQGNNILFETIMARQGFLINDVGGHGTAYGIEKVYSFKIEMINGQPFTELQRVNGKLVCPVCGEDVGEGVSVCPKCKINLK